MEQNTQYSSALISHWEEFDSGILSDAFSLFEVVRISDVDSDEAGVSDGKREKVVSGLVEYAMEDTARMAPEEKEDKEEDKETMEEMKRVTGEKKACKPALRKHSHDICRPIQRFQELISVQLT